ncbi:DUF6165 family protein [Novosphingobium huizhouense]|uniref:DUF6165 family protein n=1 Tax=Novosphingobium huizhouense TaxID=2866625 RepID=UPI001CD88B9F|nr:DUF6165 family protein [Novosphingobium huizhouense]
MTSPAGMALVPAAWGEVIDKITILELKRARIADAQAQANILRELDALLAIVAERLPAPERIAAERAALAAVNAELWEVEDALRDKERAQAFDAEFVALARAVYRKNDHRAALKRAINLATGSAIVEEKSYQAYA